MEGGGLPTQAGGGSLNARLTWTLLIALAHTAVTLVHAAVHALLDVIPGLVDGAFIVAVIILGPPVGAVLTWRSHPAGPWWFVGACGAAFGYGFASHFVLPGPDNVASAGLGGWGGLFFGTSAVLGILEVAGLLVGFRLLAPRPRTPSGSPARSP